MHETVKYSNCKTWKVQNARIIKNWMLKMLKNAKYFKLQNVATTKNAKLQKYETIKYSKCFKLQNMQILKKSDCKMMIKNDGTCCSMLSNRYSSKNPP